MQSEKKIHTLKILRSKYTISSNINELFFFLYPVLDYKTTRMLNSLLIFFKYRISRIKPGVNWHTYTRYLVMNWVFTIHLKYCRVFFSIYLDLNFVFIVFGFDNIWQMNVKNICHRVYFSLTFLFSHNTLVIYNLKPLFVNFRGDMQSCNHNI